MHYHYISTVRMRDMKELTYTPTKKDIDTLYGTMITAMRKRGLTDVQIAKQFGLTIDELKTTDITL